MYTLVQETCTVYIVQYCALYMIGTFHTNSLLTDL